MAHRIRRSSMEHLELFDLDNLKLLSLNRELPPPLPPPRKYRRHRPTNQTFEHYHFLCNIKRHNTDPIYAATPMFTIIPQSTRVKHPRRLLGSRLPSYIIKPISTTSTSPEPENAGNNNDTKEEEEEEEESSDDDCQQNTNDDNNNKRDNDNDNRNSSSSNDDDEGIDDIINNDDDKLDDDDDNDRKGLVEVLLNK